MGVPGDAAIRHRLRHRLREPSAIGQFRQQSDVGVRDEALTVGDNFRAVDQTTTMHLQGALLLGEHDRLRHSHSPS